MTTLTLTRFDTLPVDARFLHEEAVHQKLDDTEALNYHTMKTQDLRPDTLVEAFDL
jgi:hypothetical protein